MKKVIFLLVTFFTTIFLSAFPLHAQTYGQHQRLGISPQPTIYLTTKNPSKEVEAFCLDRHKIIDGSYDYNYVLTSDSKKTVTVGKRSLSLQEAINEKLIKVKSLLSRSDFGSGIGLKFELQLASEINSKSPVTIKIRDSLAMGENPGKFNNFSVLEALRKPKLDIENASKTKQDEIWELDIDKSRLESLGYNSVREFQREKNLPLNGFDPLTKTKLKEEEDALIARFEAVGLNYSRSDTSVKSVSDNIDFFQTRILGIKENITRVFSSDVRQKFEKYERFDFPIIRELKEYNTDLDSSLVLRVKSEIGQENLYTVYSHFRIEYEGNSASEINNFISRIFPRFGNVILDLDFPSQEKANGFKSSIEIAQIKTRVTFFEGKPEARKVFFSPNKTFEIDTITKPVLENKNYSVTTVLKSTEPAEINKSWKIKAISKIKGTVVKFTSAFKTIIQRKEKQSLANIVSKARKIDSANKSDSEITINFIDEFGEKHTIKIFSGKSVVVTTE